MYGAARAEGARTGGGSIEGGKEVRGSKVCLARRAREQSRGRAEQSEYQSIWKREDGGNWKRKSYLPRPIRPSNARSMPEWQIWTEPFGARGCRDQGQAAAGVRAYWLY